MQNIIIASQCCVTPTHGSWHITQRIHAASISPFFTLWRDTALLLLHNATGVKCVAPQWTRLSTMSTCVRIDKSPKTTAKFRPNNARSTAFTEVKYFQHTTVFSYLSCILRHIHNSSKDLHQKALSTSRRLCMLYRFNLWMASMCQ